MKGSTTSNLPAAAAEVLSRLMEKAPRLSVWQALESLDSTFSDPQADFHDRCVAGGAMRLVFELELRRLGFMVRLTPRRSSPTRGRLGRR